MTNEKMWYNTIIMLMLFQMALLNVQQYSLKELIHLNTQLSDIRQEHNLLVQELDLNITKTIVQYIKRNKDVNCTE